MHKNALLIGFLMGCTQDPPAAPEPEQTPVQPPTPQGKPGKAPGTKRGPKPASGQAQRPDSRGDGASVTVTVRDGRVFVTGSWVHFGPRTPPPVEGFVMPELPAAPGQTGAEASAAGGGARGAGGPPGAMADRQLAGVPDVAVPWEFHGGNGVDHTDVWVDGFWLGQFEVTRDEYAHFLSDTGYRPPHVSEAWAEDGWNWTGTTPPPGTGDHPVVLVSWYDAREYCAWAGGRLPTEAEWQLAALGPWGSARHYPWGDTYDEDALNHGMMAAPNFDDSDGFQTTSPVGSFAKGASIYGALDLFGNAWEYTADMRVDTWDLMTAIPAATQAHPNGKRQVRALEPGLYVAVRGGSYFFDLRPNPGGERHRFLTEIRRKTSGFRCAWDLP